jgi:SRSO17 transposase
VLDRSATTWLTRLLLWLEVFEDDFSRQSQRGALRRYVTGVLSDSRRKSMEAMWARLSDPGAYQAFQHFITHAPWSRDRVGGCACGAGSVCVLILDGQLRQGTASVSVARQCHSAR